MTSLDWVIVAFAALMAMGGYAVGLIVGALALVGFVAGAFAGSRLGPELLAEGAQSPWAPLFALGGALLLGLFLASILQTLGFHVRRRLGESIGVLDGLGGAVLVAALALGFVWIVGAVALQTPGARELREPIQRSAIMRELNAVLPPSGALLRALARFDPFPRIQGPGANVRPPSSRIARDTDVARAAGSVVRVLGTACGLGVQGSGWIAANGLVVTNAHVVAGQDDTSVDLGGDGGAVEADAVWFDVGNDLAILSAPGLSGSPALSLAVGAEEGAPAAVLGFPGNGSYDVRPARLGATRTIVSQDAYGQGPVQRDVTSLRGLVRSGNSGGPVVDGDGEVVATVFAASTDDAGHRTGYGVPNAIVADALRRAGGPVDTGPCVR